MSVKSCVECSNRAHGKICSWELLTVNIWVWLIRKIEVISVIWVNCNSVTSWSVCKWILLSSTVEDLLSGHPRAAKKVFVPGDGRLRECKKKILYGSWVKRGFCEDGRKYSCPLTKVSVTASTVLQCFSALSVPYAFFMLFTSLRIPSCLTETHRLNPGCV